MRARDVMISPVFTVKSSSSVQEVAKLLLERSISTIPVVDDRGKIVGIISDGDLMNCTEASIEIQRSQRSERLRLFANDETCADDILNARSRKVADVMTKKVITAWPSTFLREIAALLERNSIKCMPIVKDGQVVGIVSRENLNRAMADSQKALDALQIALAVDR
jgi:CBS domain-containing protein